MTDLPSDAYLPRAAQAAYALLYEDAPYVADSRPLEWFGPFGEVIRELRAFHQAAIELTAKTGKLYDVYTDARTLWEGMRASDDGHKQYNLLDYEIRRIGDALCDTPRPKPWEVAPALSTNGAGSVSEYAVAPVTPHPISGLFAEKPDPIIYYAGGFLREGLGLFVGEPGIGKTPAVMQLAMSISNGVPWLGSVPCQRARVLYWGIEYSKKELYPLIRASQFGHDLDDAWFRYMTLDDPLPQTPEQALNQLEYYIATLDFRVIVLDVFTGFLPPEIRKQNIYRGDYKEMQPYHKLALSYGASILGTWHTTKRESDPRWMHNASTGIWSVPSSRITMYFDSDMRVRVHSKPRLADKIDWALTQEKSQRGHRWIVADANPEPVCSPTELTIYRFLRSNSDISRQLGPSTTAEMVNIPHGTAKTLLLRMHERNLIQRGKTGYYIDKHDVADDEKRIEEQPMQQIPQDKRTILQCYLRGNKESDQERARQLCEEYGLDYERAYLEVHHVT